MLNIAVAYITASLAQKARDWTGGGDGLAGFTMAPLFGRFDFDLEGRTFAPYALGALAMDTLAGAAGAVSAQTSAIVGLDSLSFAVSAEALVMLMARKLLEASPSPAWQEACDPARRLKSFL